MQLKRAANDGSPFTLYDLKKLSQGHSHKAGNFQISVG